MLLGDFNVRLGMWDSSRDPWGLVRGPHGHGSVNNAGKTVCNTWFQKKKYTSLLGNIQSQSAGIVLTIIIVLRQSDEQLHCMCGCGS